LWKNRKSLSYNIARRLENVRVKINLCSKRFKLEEFCYLVPIHGFIKGTDEFPIQKCAIFRKFKEIGGNARRRTVLHAAKRFQTCHAKGVIDAEIAGKGDLWIGN